MSKLLYLYQYIDLENFDTPKKVTVVFVNQENLSNQEYVADEVKAFFERHIISDFLIVLLPSYLSPESTSWFIEGKEETFKRLPGRSTSYFDQCYYVYTYSTDGIIKHFPKKILKKDEEFVKSLFRHGNTLIFKNNGGLVESSKDHHFVFPSNKHCAKFIRTGNVLVHNTEIFFIAYQILQRLKDYKTIYCDTASINVLPFAALELARRLGIMNDFPSVESFNSYEVFEARKTPFSPTDFVLISSSTSGNIIDRMVKNQLVTPEQVLLIYFLGPQDRSHAHQKNILCDLTYDNMKFPVGVDQFDTYPNELECTLCRDFSFPIKIQGDVFLTVKPKITKVLLTATFKHVPKFLNGFVEAYRVDKSLHPTDAVIRAYYKETKGDNEANYETYIDTSKIYTKKEFEKKLDRLIDKHIPANTKYLIYLPDESSKKLAEIISEKASWKKTPSMIRLNDDLGKHLKNEPGCAIIVASCIVTGKNLLHVSRVMRPFDELSLIYFIGVFGTNNESNESTLKSSLSRGKDRSDIRPIVAVESIYTALDKYNTIWELEKNYLENLIAECDEEKQLFLLINERINTLLDNKATIGLSDDVFLKTHNNERLYLRKNFAFWDFNYNEKEVFQSEVHFSINSIINFLENKEIRSDCSLQQSTYVRNILSTENFTRFNDGIIQASLLRSVSPECLSYDLDIDSSIQMRTLLESMLDKHDTEHGEAIMEFLLAIGMRRLRLQREDRNHILKLGQRCNHQVIQEFCGLIAEQLKN